MRRVVLCLGLVACFPDDWNGQPYRPGGTGGTSAGETGAPGGDLVGDWVSEGSDLSDLFAGEPFSYVSVEAVFHGDGTYVVTSEDDGGTQYVLSGTYTVVVGDPGTISLDQTNPYEAHAEGIWQVAGDELTYEVVQTVPDYGFTPPTPEDGFGSTAGPGMAPGINVQTYHRR